MSLEKQKCPICDGTGKIYLSVSDIAERRVKLNLSRYGLAAASGISNVTIRNIEVGATKPRLSTIQSLRETLDKLEKGDTSSVDRTWILRRRGEEKDGESIKEDAGERSETSTEPFSEGSREPARRVFYEAGDDDDWEEEIEEEDGE